MKTMATVLATLALAVTVSGPVLAEVNCKQVRRYAETGRSAEDIAETMIIDLDHVKQCLKGESGNPDPTPAAPAARPAG